MSKTNDNDGKCPLCNWYLDKPCTYCLRSSKMNPGLCTIINAKCGHSFHKHCIDRWLEKNDKCPVEGCGKTLEFE